MSTCLVKVWRYCMTAFLLKCFIKFLKSSESINDKGWFVLMINLSNILIDLLSFVGSCESISTSSLCNDDTLEMYVVVSIHYLIKYLMVTGYVIFVKKHLIKGVISIIIKINIIIFRYK
jgi:hypothetical protein